MRLRYSCSLTVKLALMGSSVETVVTALLGGTDQIADLRGGGAGDAIDGRSEFGEAEIDFRGFDRGRSGGNAGLRRLDLRLRGFDLGLRGGHLRLATIDWSAWRCRDPAA